MYQRKWHALETIFPFVQFILRILHKWYLNIDKMSQCGFFFHLMWIVADVVDHVIEQEKILIKLKADWKGFWWFYCALFHILVIKSFIWKYFSDWMTSSSDFARFLPNIVCDSDEFHLEPVAKFKCSSINDSGEKETVLV